MIKLVKISSVSDIITPLGMACLQAYYKQCGNNVIVTNYRTSKYTYSENLIYTFERVYVSNCVMNHTELPLAVYLVKSILTNKLDEDTLNILMADYASRVGEPATITLNRLNAMFMYILEILPDIVKSTSKVMFSVNYLNILETVLASSLIKKYHKEIKIVWGGPTVTQSNIALQLFKTMGIVDTLVVGSADGCNINVLNTPDYSNLRLDTYPLPPSVYTSRGCTNRCTFCSEWNLLGNKIQIRDIPKVINDIKDVVSNTGTNYIMFADSLLNHSEKYFNELCDTLIKENLGIHFGGMCRVGLSKASILKAKEAGFTDMAIGIETAIQSVSLKMNKRTNVCNNMQEIQKWSNVGINLKVLILVGYGTEKEEIASYYEVCQYIRNTPKTITFRPSSFMLLPGSIDYNKGTVQTYPWHSLKTNPETLKIEEQLQNIPYTFKYKIPKHTIEKIIKGIQINEAIRND